MVILFLSVCIDGQLMLVGGSNEAEGRVEICRGNSYGSVCDDRWDSADATVVCRQLGFNGVEFNIVLLVNAICIFLIASDVIAFGRAYFGEGSGDIFLDELACTGNEQRLSDCATDLSHDCTHAEDAGVRCGG